MLLKETEIEGCFLIELSTFKDDRGWFSRIFCKDSLAALGLHFEIKQVNHSFNAKKHTFRGMHMQQPPFTEGKIVRCISGAVQDIVLDLRSDSKTFLKSASFLLSEENKACLFIPKGLAHGFLSLEDASSLSYFHDTNYAPGSEFCVRYNDPNIQLNLLHDIKHISQKDETYPLLPSDFKGFQL